MAGAHWQPLHFSGWLLGGASILRSTVRELNRWGWIKKLPRHRWNWNEGVCLLPRASAGGEGVKLQPLSPENARLLLPQGLESISTYGN